MDEERRRRGLPNRRCTVTNKPVVEFPTIVGERVEEARHLLRAANPKRFTQAAVAEALGITKSAYGEKCIGVRNEWHLGEIPALRAYFEKHLDEALPGWPVIELAQARALAAILRVARAAGPHVSGGTGDQSAIIRATDKETLKRIFSLDSLKMNPTSRLSPRRR